MIDEKDTGPGLSWWWEPLTVAFGLMILAGLAIVVVALTEASGVARVLVVLVGAALVLVGGRLQLANWHERH